MHYMSTIKTLIKKQSVKKKKKMALVQNAVILSESIFMASNFFMQMFNVSTLCIQSIKMFQ